MKSQAIILAGGKGTRLRDRLGDLPKPLITIGGKRLLEWQIQLLLRHGYTDVLILVNYQAQEIKNFCVSKANWGINIECIDDGGQPLGTAGALLSVQHLLENEFLVMYGDTMLDVDLTRFRKFHDSHSGIAATLFVHPNDHPQDSDLIEVDEKGIIRCFHPYPHDVDTYYSNLVNAALYYLNRNSLDNFNDLLPPLDFGRDLFPLMLNRGLNLLGYNSFEYIKDCGTPERLDKVENDILSGRLSRVSIERGQPTIFLDRDGTINKEINHLAAHENFELLPEVGLAIKRLNQADFRVVVITNQPVIARGDCSLEGLEYIHKKMESLLGREGAYLDRIYYCPHHPESGFPGEKIELKIKCKCRKPDTGMVDYAIQDLNIDIQQSWVIGDSTVDIFLAKKCQIRSILVETGFAGLDESYHVIPNYTVPNLSSAVEFILETYPRYLKLCEHYGAEIRGGDFIFIGGLARSGKSNFASSLKEYLGSKGINAVLMPLDRWLRSGSEREKGVRGRYHIEEVESLLKKLSSREDMVEIKLAHYSKLSKERILGAEFLRVHPSDVIIVEGTIAMDFVGLVDSIKSYAWFVEVSEDERKRRFIQEYMLRGLSIPEAGEVYRSREVDETPIIRGSSKNASAIISLDALQT